MPDYSFASEFFCTCARGYAQMSSEAQEALAVSIKNSQTANGLFADCAGKSDLYYTLFGLLLAAVSGADIERTACLKSLKSMDFDKMTLVYASAYLRCKGLLWLLRRVPVKYRPRIVRDLRLPGARQAASLLLRPVVDFPQNDPNAPYALFLLNTLLADCGLPARDISLAEYRLPNALYSNLRQAETYSVNATAAALWLLPARERQETAGALQALQRQDGSFAAAEAAPHGDLLSTATAILSLKKCAMPLNYELKDFLRGCFRDHAMFASTPDSPDGDLEYTVYGLLAMGGQL